MGNGSKSKEYAANAKMEMNKGGYGISSSKKIN